MQMTTERDANGSHAPSIAAEVPTSIQTTMRMDPSMLDRADRLIDSFTKRYGKRATRTDVLREALAKGLRALELDELGR